MKERILTGWTFTRALYVVLGAFLIGQSIMDKQWFGVFFGGYFASMGIFSFGCAAGNCAVPVQKKTNTTTQDIEFEEVK